MIKGVEFELKTGHKITIFAATTVTVQEGEDGQVYVLDGLHNNGGWRVKGTYQEVVDKVRFL